MIVDLYGAEAHPDAEGRVRLSIQVRNATSLQWVKNGINLKEGADGGRIMGVDKPELLITRLLGRDKDQKVWCVAKNKWGTVQSKQIILRVPASVQQAQPSAAITAALERSAGSTLMGSTLGSARGRGESGDAGGHKSLFGAALADVTSGAKSFVRSVKDRSNSGSRTQRSNSQWNDGDTIDDSASTALNGLRRADGSVVEEKSIKQKALVSTGL